MSLQTLNKTELDQRMKTLAQKERDLLHEILLTIKEIDLRRTYLELGFGSLFDYLVSGIGYSEGSAQRRIDAARLLKELPQMAEKIQTGEIKLNQISLVQKTAREVAKNRAVKVTANDKLALLEKLSGKSTSASQHEVAAFFDFPVLSHQRQKTQADESVRLELTLTKAAFEKLNQARSLLSHAVPTQDLAVFLEYISEKVIQQKTGAGKNKKSSPTVTAKGLPIRTRQQVLTQQGCCQYKDPSTGRICDSKWLLQVDHKQAKWANGTHEIENLQTLCARHNNLKYKRESGVRYKS